MKAMAYEMTGSTKVNTKSAKKYDTKEFYSGKSVFSIIVGALSYIYFEHEVGILRLLLGGISLVWTLDQLLPFWRDLVGSIISGIVH